jgi:TPR repeat protein
MRRIDLRACAALLAIGSSLSCAHSSAPASPSTPHPAVPDAAAASPAQRPIDDGRTCDPTATGCKEASYAYGPSQGLTRELARDCDAGNAESCNLLGLQFENGSGVAKDLVHAAALYAKACAGGFSGPAAISGTRMRVVAASRRTWREA